MNDWPDDAPGDPTTASAAPVADWITTPLTAGLLRGALDLEHTEHGVLPHRLPARARAQCADGLLAMAEAQASGVRLVFRTRATAIELDALRTKNAYQGAPPRPDGLYDLFVDGRPAGQAGVTGGNVLMVDLTTGSAETRPGPVGTLRFTGLPDRVKDVEIWLPHNEITQLVALRTDAPVEPLPDAGRKKWLHHGSSISHGSDAASPSTTWPALAASLGGVELTNLGLSGSALLDPFTARALRDTPADLISVKIGINLVNADLMRLRAFGPGGARLPRHHPRGTPRRSAPGRLTPPVPDPRGHPRPQRPGLQQPQRGKAPVPGRGRSRGTGRRETDPQRHPGGTGPPREAAGSRRPEPALPRRPRPLR